MVMTLPSCRSLRASSNLEKRKNNNKNNCPPLRWRLSHSHFSGDLNVAVALELREKSVIANCGGLGLLGEKFLKGLRHILSPLPAGGALEREHFLILIFFLVKS